MSLDTHSVTPVEPAGYRDIGLPPNWNERIVTAVAVSVAILIVAIIAVLMGMA